MLAAIPADPRRQIVDAERDQHHQPLEAAEAALGAFREDLLALFVERLAHMRRIDRFGLVAFDGCGVGGGLRIHKWDIPDIAY
ncbi:hypothetical protein D9M72_544110 [compost metagenome]